jgi:trigger factor
MQSIVEQNFFLAVQAEKLETLGAPQITLQKFAPDNDLVFKAEVALVPSVTLPDLKNISVDSKPVVIEKKQIEETIENLRKLQPKEILKNGAATTTDKVVVGLEMFIDKVPVEGGQARNHQVYLSEPHYIPGFAEKLVGTTKGEVKEFNLKFPKEHYQKHLAGKDIDFKVTVNDVFTLEYPELNDEFAKTLGQKNLAELTELLTKNLTKEAERKEEQRFEAAILEQMIEKSTFGDLPEVLINSEKQKMFYELKHSLDEQGVGIEQYLADLKKTEKEIFDDFAEQAKKRSKAALLSRVIAKQENLSISPEELAEEIKLIRDSYPNNETVEQNLKRPEVLGTIHTTLLNKKVLHWLKEKIVTK